MEQGLSTGNVAELKQISTLNNCDITDSAYTKLYRPFYEASPTIWLFYNELPAAASDEANQATDGTGRMER